MFGMGMPEIFLILALALIVIGPKKLPDLAKSLGRALGEFRRATDDLKDSIQRESGLDDIRNDIKKIDNDIKSPANAVNSTRAAETKLGGNHLNDKPSTQDKVSVNSEKDPLADNSTLSQDNGPEYGKSDSQDKKNL
ncbi:MAG: twin-arginine translocase TatA/TatE family subunit [Desulfobacteraceae bacterium]|nr:twin-arginine translocase TatA/TatE family subunit [Desulfobacteraceae bacterium]